LLHTYQFLMEIGTDGGNRWRWFLEDVLEIVNNKVEALLKNLADVWRNTHKEAKKKDCKALFYIHQYVTYDCIIFYVLYIPFPILFLHESLLHWPTTIIFLCSLFSIVFELLIAWRDWIRFRCCLHLMIIITYHD